MPTEQKELVTTFPRRKKYSLVDWFMKTEQEVLDEFANLPGATKMGSGDRQFVFVPGTRQDRCLLVAHSDTVWNDSGVEIAMTDGVYHSAVEGKGIGADDRAGIAMLWYLRDLGHSLLIPNGEESGCIGSRFLMEDKSWSSFINEHNFAIEMDRMNDDNLVFYSVGSQAYQDWAEKEFTGYKRQGGSWTDICVLCEPMAGMNISIGYYHQHTSNEILILSEWNRTLSKLRHVLSKPDLPKFIQDPKPVWTPPKYNRNRSYNRTQVVQEYDSYSDYFRNRWGGETRNMATSDIRILDVKNNDIKASVRAITTLVCPWCDFTQDEGEWRINGNKCINNNCKKEF